MKSTSLIFEKAQRQSHFFYSVAQERSAWACLRKNLSPSYDCGRFVDEGRGVEPRGMAQGSRVAVFGVLNARREAMWHQIRVGSVRLPTEATLGRHTRRNKQLEWPATSAGGNGGVCGPPPQCSPYRTRSSTCTTLSGMKLGGGGGGGRGTFALTT